MAKTAQQIIDIKEPLNNVAFPVASGETIYQGTFAIINSGYLKNLTSTNATQGDIVGLVNDGSANASGPAATTANGSISGSFEETSADAGDKTVRWVWLNGLVRVTGSGFAQTSVGKVCYLADNYTGNITGNGIQLGTITTYISSTVVYVDMNKYYNNNGVITAKLPVTAATTTTGGDAINWTAGKIIYVNCVHLDITTPATGAATMDVGIAATGTSNDTLMDGVDVGTAAIYANPYANAGTNGGAPRKATATQYVTATPSATLAGLVGTAIIEYVVA
jgi:hypothetical protein